MASNEEILAGLAEIVNEETGLATEAVELDKSFTEDLDIDSISMMTIVVNAEEKFGVRIPTKSQEPQTVGDAVLHRQPPARSNAHPHYLTSSLKRRPRTLRPTKRTAQASDITHRSPLAPTPPFPPPRSSPPPTPPYSQLP